MLTEKELIDGQRWLACWEKVTIKPLTSRETLFAREVESAACAERDKRVAELERELAEDRKDAERYRWLAWTSDTQPICIYEISTGQVLFGSRAGTVIDKARKYTPRT